MTAEHSGEPWRMVIADDHPVMLEGTAQLFAECPDLLVVGTAMTGEETLQLVAALKPDLLILDIRLPDISGIAVAKAIRKNTPNVCILVLTGYDDPAYAKALAKLGVQGMLAKTTPGSDIVDAVRRIRTGERLPMQAPAPFEQSIATLTEREQTVLGLLAAGYRNREMAERLQVSLKTVEFHVSQLLEKLGVRSRTEAMGKAIALGLIAPSDAPPGET
jgi:DNA-binding NarL/FixJ family response regulator